jgi:RNA-directed DNA polymerase
MKTRQKSEHRVVAEGIRKFTQTQSCKAQGGAKAMSVTEGTTQIKLRFGTAENRGESKPRADGGTAVHLRTPVPCAVPKPNSKGETCLSATMEEISKCLSTAFSKVAANDGAPGPDGQSIDMVRTHLDTILPLLTRSLLDGSYMPGDIRRVWIPKSGKDFRGLGIPNVIDRMVAEAVRQVIEPLYEPTFHASSHGFRPERGCHSAITQAKKYVEEGYEYVVDIDLEKFFDGVNHQRLMARLAKRVEDKRILVLVGQMLKAKVVMPDGVRVSTEEGVPQGGPLSPLLSNIVLDELDQELEQRGHRFVRYADDANIYVKSERAGQRVMASTAQFIRKRLRLKINESKSAVAKPEERHFLGFRLRVNPETQEGEVLLSKRTKERIDAKIRELTPRTWGDSMKSAITQINVYLRGWFGFFGICTSSEEKTFGNLDSHLRRRLRAIQLQHWKTRRTQARKLINLGVQPRRAWMEIYKGRKSIWKLSLGWSAHQGLRNAYFAARGLVSLKALWRLKHEVAIVAPRQIEMSLG